MRGPRGSRRIQTPTPIPGFADPFSSLSHLAGGAAVLAFAGPLLRRGSRAPLRSRRTRVFRVATLGVFAASAVVLLAMSGVYHMLPRGGPARDVLQRLDHAAIFVLIAGTFTPIEGVLFRGARRWGMLVFVWLFAVAGVVLKSVFFASVSGGLGVTLYLAMGWLGLFSAVGIARRFSFRSTLLILWGGLAYTAGAVVDFAAPAPLIPGLIGPHELFHGAILLGLGLHARFVWLIADAPAPGAPRAR